MVTMTQVHSNSKPYTGEQVALVRAELDRILHSETFSGSGRSRDFLSYVVSRVLAGDYQGLTERFIGTALFGRVVDYETSADPIVRVRANDVRRRLVQYYSNPQTGSEVRINLATGGYVPEFLWAVSDSDDEKPTLSANTAREPEQPPLSAISHEKLLRIPRSRRFLVVSCLVILALTVSAAFCLTRLLHQSNFDRFWQPVVTSRLAPVLLLPTSTTYQIGYESVLQTTSSRSSHDAQQTQISVNDLFAFHDWHVSLPVFRAAVAVLLAMPLKNKTPILRIGTEMQSDEVRGHPVIAVGSFSNPWVQENVSGLRYTFDYRGTGLEAPFIRDAHNPNRSWSLSVIYPKAQTRDYAIVTRTFNPQTHEVFLSLAGLHSFGNQIAGEFVSQPSSWDIVAKRAPSGWQNMNMQIVLEADIVGTTPSSPRIDDIYFWK